MLILPTPEQVGYPLAEPGPYYVGRRTYQLVDSNRNNRPVEIIVWYPALLSEGSTGTVPMREAELQRRPVPGHSFGYQSSRDLRTNPGQPRFCLGQRQQNRYLPSLG